MSIAERIYQQVKTLPESAAREVLDFAEFIESKLAREAAGQSASTDPQAGASSRWPEAVLAFEGMPDMPPFEQDRIHLLPPSLASARQGSTLALPSLSQRL